MNTFATAADPARWFCVRTQPRRERFAAENLRRRVGLEVFAPYLRQPRAGRHGAPGCTREALFPGYLFARFAFPRQYRHVASTSGVTGIVRFRGEPPAVADGVIESLRRHVETTAGEITPVLGPGTWVRLAAGCFRSAEGRILQFDSRNDRVRVLLTLLGREVQVSVPAAGVRPAAPLAHYPPPLLAPARD